MLYEIQVTSEPSTLSTILNDHTLEFRVTWNTRYEYWTLDISEEGVVLVRGLPLLLGGNIIKQHNLPIAGLFVFDSDRTNVDAGQFDLGTRVLLIAVEDQVDFAELQEAV